MAADLPDFPTRIDTNSRPMDNRFLYLLGPNLPVDFNGVAEDAGSPVAPAAALSQLASFTVTGGATKVTFAFTTQSNADDYYIEYWQTTDPSNKSGVVTTISGLEVPVTSGVNVSAKGQARFAYGRGAWHVGAFSATASGTAA